MRQNQRTRTIHSFRIKKIQILVATDVAARGIDVLSISHVINFDAPSTLDDFIHRIGRTGRAGGKGLAFSFFSYKDRQIQKEIEKFSGIKIEGTAAAAPDKKKKKPFLKKQRSNDFRPRTNDFRPRRNNAWGKKSKKITCTNIPKLLHQYLEEQENAIMQFPRSF